MQLNTVICFVIVTSTCRTGPLITSWCMSKHKRVAQIGNYKNVPLSVAKRHQRLMCSYLTGDDFFGQKADTGPGILF